MMKNNIDNAIGVYVHIPFCAKKCNYCDFLSFEANDDVKEKYIDALCSEIKYYCKEKRLAADTVFIGGGTPSILKPKLIEKLTHTMKSYIDFTDDCEFTVEANPGTMDKEKALTFKEAGVNRISLGVQSFDDALLLRLGRIHRRKEFFETYEMLRHEGFDNINTDIMFSLPGLSFGKWKETVEEVTQLRPEHISFYSLMIEEGTPFYEEWKKGTLKEASDDDDRKMYRYACERLSEKGYIQYEISNAALPGRKSIHNLKYWSMQEYIGFGLGAHSFMQGRRFANTDDMNKYTELYGGTLSGEKEKHVVININTVKDNAEEFIFTGLRKLEGVKKKDFFLLTGTEIEKVYSTEIKKMICEEMLKDHGDRIALTKKGLDFSNYVMREFIKDKWEL